MTLIGRLVALRPLTTPSKSYRPAKLWLGVVALLLASTSALTADAALTLPSVGTLFEIERQAEYLVADERYASVDSVWQTDAFQPFDDALETGAPDVWLRWRLRAPDDARYDWRLSIKRRYYHQLEVFVIDPTSGERSRFSVGLDDYVPGELTASSFVVPLALAPGEERVLLMRVDTVQQALAPLDVLVQDELSFRRQRSTSLWAFGIYFGAVLALLVYNLMLYLSLRTPGLRMYVITISSVLLFMSFDTGLLQTLLPPALRAREMAYYVASAALMAIMTLRFYQVFASSRATAPRSDRLVLGAMIVLALPAVAVLVAPLPAAALLAPSIQVLISLSTLLLLGVSLTSGLRGSTYALVFFVAWAALLSSSIVRTLVSVGQLPRVPAFEYMVYVGSVVEAMILALGLSYRVGKLRDARLESERERLRALEMAYMDALTGAHNRRYLSSYLSEALASLDPARPRGALVLFDLDRFKPINDTYGHDAGDAVLLAVAERCRAALREGDVFCRLGGDEFAIVLPDLPSGESALAAAERLRRRMTDDPVVHKGQPLSFGASMGVLSPLDCTSDEETAMKRADEALYAAKRAGRNCSRVYEGSASGDVREPGATQDVLEVVALE
ncbi:MAG: diguanylate cyclase, partial [Pseudomonadota bacterium]